MRRNIICFAVMMLMALTAVIAKAQGYKANNGIVIVKTSIFTMLAPIQKVLYSDDPSVKIRQQPNVKSKAVGDIYFFEGLGTAVLLEEQTDKWIRVGDHKNMGFSNSSYLDRMTWYTGKGEYRLVAEGLAPIYVESMADSDDANEYRYDKALCYVQSGCIIADKFRETSRYYILETVHTGLVIPKYGVRKEKIR